MSRANKTQTVRSVVAAAARRLQAAGLTYGHGTFNAREEASWLVLHACRISPGDFKSHAGNPVSAAQLKRVEALVGRRIGERIPAAYLTHEAWLGEFRFYVDRRVIVPRSFIAELLGEDIRAFLQGPVRHALDLCTGSGCLAIVMAHAFADAKVDAVDLSTAALAVAKRNVSDYGLRQRVELARSDLFSSLTLRRYDLIVSNPPYVNAAAMGALPDEYRAEPRMALVGGPDGLELVRRILTGARHRLKPKGVLVCEIGHNRRALERAFPKLPFTWLQTSGGNGLVFLLEKDQLPA